ncbi:hypothetical protein FDO65_21870 [Nakamurella flava]|uniref:Uncharacterized protein n=1 Tax=Nakamurella flava TaxID=2576308 RepID=A0A4U6Q7T5_9ACTN|nr:hypothetical protein [Nakamurella flava]TKV55991.1 hypothetical protein FDO65_21870 [Nakamurella flava]
MAATSQQVTEAPTTTATSPSPVVAAGPTASSPAGPTAEVIGGGRTLLPGRTFVALYGSPGISGLGALGQ